MNDLPKNITGLLYVNPYYDFESFHLALSEREMQFRDVGMYGHFQPNVLEELELHWELTGWQ